MNLRLEEILHKRIEDKCIPLYKNKHFPQAAAESMKQVELAIKEKTGIKNKYGERLIEAVFGTEESIKLRAFFEEGRQKEVKELFRGTFSYYRNYGAHDGEKIDRITSIRIMILASELLGLIDTSPISFTEIGGIEGLIKKGIFKNGLQLFELLSFLSTQNIPYDTFDGMFEQLAKMGYSDKQYQAVFDLGLIEYHSEPMKEDDKLDIDLGSKEEIGWFELTKEGQKVLEKIQSSSKK